MKSFTQALMFEVNRGKIKPPKQILLPYAVKTVTDIVELIQMLIIVTATESPVPSLKKSTLHCASKNDIKSCYIAGVFLVTARPFIG